MKLELIAAITAWNTDELSVELLPPGTLIAEWRIVPGETGASEPYLVFFKSNQREYFCALPVFLPRTQSIQLVAESLPQESSVAV